jgi:hypothetical protein
MEHSEDEKRINSTSLNLNNFLYPKLDSFFYKYQDRLFYLTLITLILFGIFLFDVKISEGTDDSMYLLDAKKFIEGKSFPSFHGVFYSIIIGWFIEVVGFHLIFFKSLSLLFLIGHHIFFYLTFKHRISPFLLISTLLIICLNNTIIYFGSQTYTEAFYMFLQSLFFYILLKHFTNFPNNFNHIRANWGKYLNLGVILFIISTTRNVGLGAVLVTFLYLLVDKKFIPLLYTFLSFSLFKASFTLYKKIVWGISDSDLATQINLALQKNPYNKAQGNENISGMITRIIENLKIYLSNLFLNIIHIRNNNFIDTNLFISLIIIFILLVGLIIALKKTKHVLFPVYLYLGISFGITFISLSQIWGQTRLIVVFVPFIILCLFWPFAFISRLKSMDIIKIIPIIFIVFITFREFIATSKMAHENKKVLAKNLAGNKYYGYTPDLVNYLKLSEWSAKNIPENVMIGSRIASMSFIYGNGREFYPIFKLPFEEVDSVISFAQFKNNLLYFINDDNVYNKDLRLILPIKRYLYASIIVDDALYGMYNIPENEKQSFELILEHAKINNCIALADFKENILNKGTEKSALIPDKLLQEYKLKNVHFLLSGNLRHYKEEKTKFIINTIERSMTIINQKYPGIFIKVKQIGKNADEPASLYKIDYNKYNF